MTEEKGELDVEIAGQKLRTKGYRLQDLIGLVAAAMMGYTVFLVHTHAADADRAVQAVKDNQNNVSKSQEVLTQTLKESNAAIVDAMKQMTEQQRRSNEIGREQTCILTLPPDRRTNSAEFCKRISRERDR